MSQSLVPLSDWWFTLYQHLRPFSQWEGDYLVSISHLLQTARGCERSILPWASMVGLKWAAYSPLLPHGSFSLLSGCRNSIDRDTATWSTKKWYGFTCQAWSHWRLLKPYNALLLWILLVWRRWVTSTQPVKVPRPSEAVPELKHSGWQHKAKQEQILCKKRSQLVPIHLLFVSSDPLWCLWHRRWGSGVSPVC